MSSTQQLIQSLAQEAKPARSMLSPVALLGRLGGVLLVYALIVGVVLGVRADILVQLARPFYLGEVVALFVVSLTSLMAAIHLMFPDQYQKHMVLPIPILSAAALIILYLMQAAFPVDARMVIAENADGMECAICITSIAVLPSALLLIFLHKGASIRPVASGAFACIAAASVGCLMLRLAEPNDSLLHLAIWHYIPTFLFAAIGGILGKLFLKW